MSVLDDLRGIVGPGHCLVEGDLSAWEVDWRRRFHGRALAVVRPGSTVEVAAVVKACAANGVSVVPQGGNTGLVGGSVPDASGEQVVVTLSRMNRIRAFDEANLTVTVDAGCVLQSLQDAASARGFLFPLSLAAEGSCTIGGNLSTNAGGTQVLRYGNARDLCLGLEVVTAEGDIWDGLTGLRKDNTGYDLRDLFIGSEGTLGIITAATVKLYPQPAARMTALATIDSIEKALALLSAAQARFGAGLTGFEVMNRVSLDLVRKYLPQVRQPLAPAAWTVLLELSDTESETHARGAFEGLLEHALESDLITDAAVAESIEQSKNMWHLRESIPMAQQEEGPNIKHDVAVPASRLAEFVSAADAALEAAFPGTRLVDFGHLGDGNLHYNLQAPEGVDAARFVEENEHAVNDLVYEQVGAVGGSFSAEHGIGALKRGDLVQRKSAVAVKMMRSIKAALDPAGTMNPGKVL